MDTFSKGALALLNSNGKNKYYVYRLIDPRTCHTFYVGKGCGDRVFQHAKAAKEIITENEDEVSLKFQTIAEILASGKEVICFIHRWGLSSTAAFEVEAALIDCYPGLTNIQSGHNCERGLVSVEDFDKMGTVQEYSEPDEDYVIIKTSVHAIELNGCLYEATRRSWKANLKNASRYKYVLSVINGLVKEVYEVDEWYADGDRIAFNGHVTQNAISELKGKLLPQKYRKKGMARPFLYKKKQINH